MAFLREYVYIIIYEGNGTASLHGGMGSCSCFFLLK